MSRLTRKLLNKRLDIFKAAERIGLKLQQVGDLYEACCPFHAEARASFKIYPKTNSFYCWGCNLGGGALHLIAYAEGKTPEQVAEEMGEDVELKEVRDALAAVELVDYTSIQAYVAYSIAKRVARKHELDVAGLEALHAAVDAGVFLEEKLDELAAHLRYNTAARKG